MVIGGAVLVRHSAIGAQQAELTFPFAGIASGAEGLAEAKTSTNSGAGGTGSIDISISASGHELSFRSPKNSDPDQRSGILSPDQVNSISD